MEISGEEHLCSNKARELFELGKEWITKLWEVKGKEVTNLKVLPKTIGRNKGFIVDVFITGQEKRVRYYAKIQAVHMETVMMHHLLKRTGCGPEEFFIVLLTCEEEEGLLQSFQHGVITREAENCTMAADWTDSDQEKIRSSENLFRTESFLLTFFVALGRFGRLPVNRDNWGLTNWEEKIDCGARFLAPRLMIIDFSSCGTDNSFTSHAGFTVDWIVKHTFMYHLQNEMEDIDSRIAYGMKFTTDTSVWQQAFEIKWMHSQQTLLHLLQQVCTDTEQWLVDTIQRFTGGEIATANTDTPIINPDEVVFLLSAFRYIVRPRQNITDWSAYKVYRLNSEYDSLLNVLNEQLSALFQWFPFPGPLRVSVAASEPVAAASVAASEPVAAAAEVAAVATVEDVQVQVATSQD